MPQRWEPDEQLVPSVLSSPKASKRMQDLPGPDRCWLVAGLTVHGLTAKDIADRTGCSIRLVKSIRAEDMTQVCVLALKETRAFTDELRLLRGELTAKQNEKAEIEAEAERLRAQVDQLLNTRMGRKMAAENKCARGHEMNRYNTYEHKGKKFCRECHRQRQASYRGVKRTGGAVVTETTRLARRVYFLENSTQGLLKVGVSLDVQRRLREIQRDGVGEIHLLGDIPGGFTIERVLHELFGDWRVHGEWFTFTPEIRGTVASILELGRYDADEIAVPSPTLDITPAP